MHIVLLEPEIPPNTGNVARLCAATNTTLHLIEPLGFSLEDKQLQRAGMDYWQHVHWHRWQNWAAFGDHLGLVAVNPPSPSLEERAGESRQFANTTASAPEARLWFIESGGPRLYTEIAFAPGDYLVFGRETAGLPKQLLERNRDRWLRIPMFNPEARSLNLSNCVALVLFEALRQQGFECET
jgi:tRNA (cytidine/uridine-2'-O-)-methyltransferase